jgi:organic hydroperoxide reductase OsmC/OhrA
MPDIFTAHLEWSGGARGPTLDPATFSRDLEVSIGPVPVPMSSAPGYRGDASRANPEAMFLAALSACQALTYLFLAARAKVPVVAYSDDADGHLMLVDGRLRMARATLRPRIRIDAGADADKARELVEKAHEQCFIANSVTTRVELEPTIELVGAPTPAE